MRKLLSGALLFLLLFGGSGVYFLSIVPAGDTTQLQATVMSRSTRSSPTGNSSILVCQLADGKKVTVESPVQAAVVTGDAVMLNTYARHLFPDKYSFAGKIIEKRSSS